MPGSSVFDLGTGLILVFFLVSLVCSAVSEKISRLLKLRARHLEKWLRETMLNGDAALLNRLYQSPHIRALSPGGEMPVAIPARTFLLAALDTFVPGAEGKKSGEEVLAAVQAMTDENPMKKTLLWWLLAADKRMEGMLGNFESWFASMEAGMSEAYRRRIWWFSLFTGIAVAVLFNVDTFSIGSHLWRDGTLRSSVAAAAAAYAAQSTPVAGADSTLAQARSALQKLDILGLPAGWRFKPFHPVDWPQTQPVAGIWPWIAKLCGWLVTGLAGAQGAPFWFDLLRKLTRRD